MWPSACIFVRAGIKNWQGSEAEGARAITMFVHVLYSKLRKPFSHNFTRVHLCFLPWSTVVWVRLPARVDIRARMDIFNELLPGMFNGRYFLVKDVHISCEVSGGQGQALTLCSDNYPKHYSCWLLSFDLSESIWAFPRLHRNDLVYRVNGYRSKLCDNQCGSANHHLSKPLTQSELNPNDA